MVTCLQCSCVTQLFKISQRYALWENFVALFHHVYSPFALHLKQMDYRHVWQISMNKISFSWFAVRLSRGLPCLQTGTKICIQGNVISFCSQECHGLCIKFFLMYPCVIWTQQPFSHQSGATRISTRHPHHTDTHASTHKCTHAHSHAHEKRWRLWESKFENLKCV